MSGERAATGRVMGWIGWAGMDAVGRLILLSAATILLSRLLDPEDFGVSAIVLAIAAAAGLMVGAPFEDALAQQKVLRRAHLRSAWAFGLLVSVVLIALSLLVAPLLADLYETPQIATLLPVTMVSILFVGHCDLVTARARRLHRFNDLAAASLIGHLVGAPVAVLAAWLGAGVWSLILLRMASVVVQSLLLQVKIGYPLLPRLSLPHLAQMRRFASISLADKLTDNLTYLFFNNLVGAFFGMAVLGYVNMAMRLVEPVRGAVLATLHNLTFPHFRRVAMRGDAAVSRDGPIRLLAFVFSAGFMGLAAVTPVLLPFVTGPGWEVSVPIGVCLALGAALILPSQSVYTCLFAIGRPEYSLFGNLAKLGVMVLSLVLLRDAPPVAVGLARLAGDAAQTLFALAVPIRAFAWPPAQRVVLLAPAWLIGGAMAFGAGAVLYAARPLGDGIALVAAIATGIFLQAALMAVFQRQALRDLLAFVRPSRPVAGEAS